MFILNLIQWIHSSCTCIYKLSPMSAIFSMSEFIFTCYEHFLAVENFDNWDCFWRFHHTDSKSSPQVIHISKQAMNNYICLKDLKGFSPLNKKKYRCVISNNKHESTQKHLTALQTAFSYMIHCGTKLKQLD